MSVCFAGYVIANAGILMSMKRQTYPQTTINVATWFNKLNIIGL